MRITNPRHWKQIIDDAFDRALAQRTIQHDELTNWELARESFVRDTAQLGISVRSYDGRVNRSGRRED